MKRIVFLTLVISTITALYAQTAVQTQVSDVTVYINGAQVTRNKTISLPTGTSTLKFTGLSPYLDDKSMQVRAGQGITILSVNRQFNYTDSTKLSNEMNMLQQKVEQINGQLKTEQANLEVLKTEQNFLNSNQNISGKEQAVSAATLKETLNFYRERTTAIKKQEIEINSKIEGLKAEKQNITRQIEQQSGKKQEPMSEIWVELTAKSAGNYAFSLSYYVANAGWFPSYDIRSNSITEPVELIYKANIRQNTKEDWKNIQLRLSSTNPTSGNVAPKLQTYLLNYGLSAPRYNVTQENSQLSGMVLDADSREPLIGASISLPGTTIGTITDVNGKYSLTLPNNASKISASYVGYTAQTQSISGNVQNFYMKTDNIASDEVVVVGYGSQKRRNVAMLSGTVAGVEMETSSFDMVSQNMMETEQTEQTTSFEVEIKMPYTLLSGNKSTTAEIGIYRLPAEYIYYCVPKIDQDAFLVANISHWQQYNLLDGEANIFFENTFVGKSVLSLSQATDTLTLSLGRDKNISVKREKQQEYTKKRILGSKNEVTRAWQTTVQNNKKQPVTLWLFDQVPVSTNSDIEVINEELSGGQANAATGEIIWRLSLEANKKQNISLRYKVKFPKERHLNVE